MTDRAHHDFDDQDYTVALYQVMRGLSFAVLEKSKDLSDDKITAKKAYVEAALGMLAEAIQLEYGYFYLTRNNIVDDDIISETNEDTAGQYNPTISMTGPSYSFEGNRTISEADARNIAIDYLIKIGYSDHLP